MLDRKALFRALCAVMIGLLFSNDAAACYRHRHRCYRWAEPTTTACLASQAAAEDISKLEYRKVAGFDPTVTGEYVYDGVVEFRDGKRVIEKKATEPAVSGFRWVILQNCLSNNFAPEQTLHDIMEKRENSSTVQYRLSWTKMKEHVTFTFKKPYRGEMEMLIQSPDSQIRGKIRKTKELRPESN